MTEQCFVKVVNLEDFLKISMSIDLLKLINVKFTYSEKAAKSPPNFCPR